MKQLAGVFDKRVARHERHDSYMGNGGHEDYEEDQDVEDPKDYATVVAALLSRVKALL